MEAAIKRLGDGVALMGFSLVSGWL